MSWGSSDNELRITASAEARFDIFPLHSGRTVGVGGTRHCAVKGAGGVGFEETGSHSFIIYLSVLEISGFRKRGLALYTSKRDLQECNPENAIDFECDQHAQMVKNVC